MTGRRSRAAAAPRSNRSAVRETRKRLRTPEKRMGAAAASAAASRPESGRLQTETGQGQTRSDPTTRWSRQRKSQDLLQRFEQLLVLIVRADRDADPPRDRLPIVMADQDLSLAQAGDNPARGLWWPHEDEVRRRGRHLKTQLLESPREPPAIGHHLVHDLPVVRLVLDCRHGGHDRQAVDVVGLLDRVEG